MLIYEMTGPNPTNFVDIGNATSILCSLHNQYLETSVSKDELTDLYHLAAPVVYRRAMAILGDKEEALDATQDVFLTIYSKLSTFRGESDITTWIYKITTNHCLNRLRSIKTDTRLLDQISKINGPQTSPNMEAAIESRDLLIYLTRRLDTRKIQILYHFYHDQMTQKEIGEVMGITERAVRKSLKKTMDKVTKQGVSLETLRGAL